VEASKSHAVLFREMNTMKCIVVCFVILFTMGCEPRLDFSSPEKTIEIYYQGWQEQRAELIEAATWKPKAESEMMKKYGSGYNFGPPDAPKKPKYQYKILSKRTVTQADIEEFVKNNTQEYVKDNEKYVGDSTVPYWLAVGDLKIIVEINYPNDPPMKVFFELRLIEKEWKIVGSSYIPDENYPDTEPPPDL
jgi:hypothetical protein